MGRDLLYKPPVPIPQQEEEDESGKKPKKTGRARELGRVGEVVRTSVQRPAGAEPVDRVGATKAYKAAYFNRDTSGVGQTNFNAHQARALRGSADASNLRDVILPMPLSDRDSPDPLLLSSASDMLGLENLGELSLQSLLGRHHALMSSDGVTVEMIEARLQQLKQMVEIRKLALERMRSQTGPNQVQNPTLEHARESEGQGVERSFDVAEEGKLLVGRSVHQADGMHRRIAKALGLQVPEPDLPE